MITLNISTNKTHKKKDIFDIFINSKVLCQLTETQSCICSKEKYKLEKGYIIKIFDTDNETFKSLIWEKLKVLLDLDCAFIKIENEYMGCIKNWPNVFVKSNCINKC